MHIAFHVGAHCTDDERLLKSLLRNRDRLAEAGICVPGPGRYRALLGEVATRLRGRAATPDTQDVLLEEILDGTETERLVLSNPSFVSAPSMAFAEGCLYPRMFKAAWLRNLFPDHAVSFHIAIRNPATFLPALHALLGPDAPPFERFTSRGDPTAPLWSEALGRLVAAVPECRVTAWCLEDTPLVFEEVMRDLAGLGPAARMHGGFDVLRHILSEEGMRRLRSYTALHPPPSVYRRRRVVTAFLEAFALEDAVMEEIDQPGWTIDLVERMTQAYERDVERIAGMEGIDLIAP